MHDVNKKTKSTEIMWVCMLFTPGAVRWCDATHITFWPYSLGLPKRYFCCGVGNMDAMGYTPHPDQNADIPLHAWKTTASKTSLHYWPTQKGNDWIFVKYCKSKEWSRCLPSGSMWFHGTFHIKLNHDLENVSAGISLYWWTTQYVTQRRSNNH